MIDVFQDTVTKHGGRLALAVKKRNRVRNYNLFCRMPALMRCNNQDGAFPRTWQTWTWTQYYDDCVKFAKSLLFLKVASFRIINIIGFNSVSRAH